MKLFHPLLIPVQILLLCGILSAQNSPPEIVLKDFKIGPLGYEIFSTDFDAEPNRRIVVTMTAAGKVVDIRGRFIDGKNIEEWSVYYKDGSPALAQLKKWRKTVLDGEELGEGLVKIDTLIAENGIFTPKKKELVTRLKELQTFAITKGSNRVGGR
jgi:hypothetical protein